MTETTMPAGRRRALPFVIALFAAPAVVAAVAAVFFQLGDYGSRFGVAGTFGLLTALPAWFTAYVWLAWRESADGPPGMKPRVKSALTANFASLLIFPFIIWIIAATGNYEAMLSAGDVPVGVTRAQGGEVDLSDPPSPRVAGIILALMTFLLGLVFLPILAAIFSWVERKLSRNDAVATFD